MIRRGASEARVQIGFYRTVVRLLLGGGLFELELSFRVPKTVVRSDR